MVEENIQKEVKYSALVRWTILKKKIIFHFLT